MIDNSFIYESLLDNPTLCDDIIDYHKNSDRKSPGMTGNKQIDLNIKNSVDCKLNYNLKLLDRYLISLQKVVNEYVEKYPMCNYYTQWGITQEIMVQFYPPNAGYFAWHTERASFEEPFSSRHLVFMTYLNDVDDGGETEFYHQNLKVNPKKGKTLIWPADWTYTHRGITSKTQEKYIVTGWFNFYKKSR